MVKLRQLEYLVAVVDTGSFGQAAMATNATQPTLSQQVRALEDELGVQLLERRSSGVIVTPVGRSVVERARSVVRDVRELRADAQRARSQLSGTLRLGTTPTLGPYLLSPFLADLHQQWPDLRLYVREGIPSLQAIELVRGGIDLHLGPLPIAGEELVVEPLFREPLHPVVAIDHPLARAAKVSVRDLHGQVMLSMDPRHHFHHQLTQIAHEHRMSVSPDYEGTSLDSLHQMVASGLGMTLLPALYLMSEVGGSSSITILKIPGWRAYRSIALAWRRSSPLGAEYAGVARRIAAMATGLLSRFEASEAGR